MERYHFVSPSINKRFSDLVLLTSPHDDVDSSILQSYLLLNIYNFPNSILTLYYISTLKSSSSSAAI
jgi:hypothetical protein